jgi:hypothetical protein
LLGQTGLVDVLTEATVLAAGGWHPRYARVVLIHQVVDEAVVLVDSNGDGAEIECERWFWAEGAWVHEDTLANIPWVVQLWQFDKAGTASRDAAWRYLIFEDALHQAERLNDVVMASREHAGVTVYRVGATLGPFPTPARGKLVLPVRPPPPD